MIPISFGGCAGWLHDGPGRRGIVLCGAFGFEDLCSHRTLALLAASIAAEGLPVLRFDYRGTGDSLDLAADEAQLDAWTADIAAAVAWMRRDKAVDEVALIGLRLGALLAARAVTRLGGVAMLGLLAPVLSGRAYLRELRALSQLIAAPQSSDEPGFDGLETAGFRLPRATVDALGALDLDAGVGRVADRLLLMPARRLPATARLEAGLIAGGSEVTAGDFEDYDALMCDPTAAQVPERALRAVQAWAIAGTPPGRSIPCVTAAATLAADGFREERVLIGAAHGMAAVFCRPAAGGPARKAVIFLNAGAVHHIGWARMNVAMARQLAAAGIASLRVDLRGIGDSLGAARGLYEASLQADIAAAVGWLIDAGIPDVTIFGMCSGAYQAFHAALGDSRIGRLVLVNQLVFNWGPAYAMQFGAWRATKASLVGATAEAALCEEEDLRDAAGVLAKFLPLARRLARNSFGALMNLSALAASMAQKNVVADWFGALSRRGTRILLVYSAGDAGLQELDRHMGKDAWRALALPNVSRRIIAGADHTLTPAQARRELADALEAFVADDHGEGVAVPRECEAA